MQEILQLGIKTESDLSDKRFMRFFSIVQQAASDLGCIFFLDCGEGNELETDDLSGEDLFGWLVKKEDADQFESLWLVGWGAIGGDWSSNEVFARWALDGDRVEITFEHVL